MNAPIAALAGHFPDLDEIPMSIGAAIKLKPRFAGSSPGERGPRVDYAPGETTEDGIVFLNEVERLAHGARWRFRCFCGDTFVTLAASVRKYRTRSCGCRRLAKRKRVQEEAA